jgi:outer membrane protein TolC
MYDAKAYGAAYDASGEAFRVFDAVRLKYRAGEISDAEFLAARAVYDKAMQAYDKAYSLAAYGGYMGAKA